MKAKITISDVASAAGVSIGTVSKVFNPNVSNTIKISEKTRVSVLETTKNLGYTPSYGARLIRSGRSFTVGFAIESERNVDPFLSSYTMEILNGIGMEAIKKGYQVLVSTGYDYPALFKTGRIDGIAIIGYCRETCGLEDELCSAYDFMESEACPFVLINGVRAKKQMPSISIDNRAGVEQIVSLILRKGYRKVGFLGELGGNRQVHHIERETILRALLKANGYEVDDRRFIHGVTDERGDIPREGKYSHTDGISGMRILHQRGLDIDCLVCGNDAIAMGALKYCKDQGIAVPERMSLIGFDDSLESEFLVPALTTVSQPMRKMGGMAFDILMDAINKPGGNVRSELLKPTLIERASA